MENIYLIISIISIIISIIAIYIVIKFKKTTPKININSKGDLELKYNGKTIYIN